MSNIIKIIIRDFRSITTNVVALVIVMGLCILPSMYAWFNINSNWDPYGEEATSNLQIAVYSKDKGIEYGKVSMAVGDSVVEALQSNTTIGWVFPEDERTTLNGVYSGEYYAALVIPEDFTENLAGVLKGELDGGHIMYYENDKKNAIGSKITGKARTAVQNQVNSTVFSTLTQTVSEVVGAVENNSRLSDTDLLMDSLEKMKADIKGHQQTLKTLQQTTDATIKAMEGVTELCDKISIDLENDLQMVSTASVAMGSSGIRTANIRLQDYILLMKDGRAGIKRTRKLLKQMYNELDELEEDIDGFRNSEQVRQIVEALKNEPEKVGEFFATPVELQKEEIYSIFNYGSQMAPFYTALSLWFGALILVAIIHTKVHSFPGLNNPKHYQEYFGRYVLYFLLGQIQTLICVLGDLFFMEIQCQHKFFFWLAAAVSSFVYTALIYSLTYALGNVGEAAAVIILVVQVAGAGGTFPKEVLPKVYQMIYRFLPFTYTMDAFKETIGGMYEDYFASCLLSLTAFLPVALFIGLVCSIPFRRMNKIIERSKERTKLMI